MVSTAPVRLDATLARRHLDQLLEVYAVAMDAPVVQLPGRRAIMQRHTDQPRFRCLVCYRDRAIAGFAYGFTGQRGQWWHDMVRTALTAAHGEPTASAWLTDSFEVGEVHVRPELQGIGIGRRLVTELCATATCGPAAAFRHRTAMLSTPQGPTRARRLYAGLGFLDLLTDYRFPGTDAPFAVMGAALPLAAGRFRPA